MRVLLGQAPEASEAAADFPLLARILSLGWSAWAGVALLALLAVNPVQAAVLTGRFSQLELKQQEARLCNADFSLLVERGFKLLYAGRTVKPDGWLDDDCFAGFATLKLPEGARWPLQYQGFKRPFDGTVVDYAGRRRARVAKRLAGKGFTSELTAEIWANYPCVWLSGKLTGNKSTSGAYVVTGYGWVKAQAPDTLAFREAGGKVHLEHLEAGRRYAFDSASGRTLVLLDSKRGLAFAFCAGGPGVTLERTGGDLVLHTPLHDAELTPVAWVTLCNPWNPYRPEVTDLAALVSAAEHLGLGGRPPVEYKWRFGGAEQPEVTYSLTPPVGTIEPVLAVPVTACGLAGKPDSSWRIPQAARRCGFASTNASG